MYRHNNHKDVSDTAVQWGASDQSCLKTNPLIAPALTIPCFLKTDLFKVTHLSVTQSAFYSRQLSECKTITAHIPMTFNIQ